MDKIKGYDTSLCRQNQVSTEVEHLRKRNEELVSENTKLKLEIDYQNKSLRGLPRDMSNQSSYPYNSNSLLKQVPLFNKKMVEFPVINEKEVPLLISDSSQLGESAYLDSQRREEKKVNRNPINQVPFNHDEMDVDFPALNTGNNKIANPYEQSLVFDSSTEKNKKSNQPNVKNGLDQKKKNTNQNRKKNKSKKQNKRVQPYEANKNEWGAGEANDQSSFKSGW